MNTKVRGEKSHAKLENRVLVHERINPRVLPGRNRKYLRSYSADRMIEISRHGGAWRGAARLGQAWHGEALAGQGSPPAGGNSNMISLEFLEEQLHARPFVPFVLVLNSGDRYSIKTADHADLPPADEETGQRNPWFIVYNQRGIPRYLALENIAALEHQSGGNGASDRAR